MLWCTKDWGRRCAAELVKTLPSEGFLLAPAIHPLKETFDRQVVEVPYPLLVEGDPRSTGCGRANFAQNLPIVLASCAYGGWTYTIS